MRDPENNNNRQVMHLDRERSMFVAKTYTLSVIFLALSCVQLFLAVLIDGFREFLKEQLYIGFLGLVFYFLTILILMNFRDIRVAPLYNLGLSLVLVEALTVAIMTLSVFYKKKNAFTAYSLAITVSLSFILLTSCCPCDALMCLPFLLLVSMFDFVFILVMLILIMVTPNPVLITIFASISLVTSVIFLIYHTLIICGGRIEITSDDPYNGAITTFIDATVIYILILLLYTPDDRLFMNY